ncbi:MAG: L-aspartate oxidase [Candidatus Eisenbacteria bacterium]|nr:L-aspartate oxidase [Candidatus Eisenbacteria bacterium]
MFGERYDFLVIGSGLAGLLFALKASRYGRVAVITKRSATDSNTQEAQGGIASVSSPEDSFLHHAEDTLRAGAGLCEPLIVERVVAEAPAAVAELESYGMRFARSEDGRAYDLGREGGHSHRRVLHSGDATGRAMQNALLERARADERIRVFEQCCAIDLITTSKLANTPFDHNRTRVVGAYLIDEQTKEIGAIAAPRVMLATGGCGKVYRYTSNPDTATGDGIAIAYRAGARLADLEFVQFHPTCLYHAREKRFLITEAIRGEGGVLRNGGGEAFMERYHALGSLAPRDVVARAIDNEMKRRGDRCVYLDVKAMSPERMRERFPTIFSTCRSLGIEVPADPIPVVPAAHYMCGGVATDAVGRTNIVHLYAAGEVACTGLHGANRLASNSLLEAAVLALQAARAATAGLREGAGIDEPLPDIPSWDPGKATVAKESVLVNAHWEMVRALMWNFVGIVRNDHRLALAAGYMQLFRGSIERYYWDFLLDTDLIELRNLALVADLIIASATKRNESRGLHYNSDHPDLAEPARHTLLDPADGSARLANPGELPFGKTDSVWRE